MTRTFPTPQKPVQPFGIPTALHRVYREPLDGPFEDPHAPYPNTRLALVATNRDGITLTRADTGQTTHIPLGGEIPAPWLTPTTFRQLDLNADATFQRLPTPPTRPRNPLTLTPTTNRPTRSNRARRRTDPLMTFPSFASRNTEKTRSPKPNWIGNTVIDEGDILSLIDELEDYGVAVEGADRVRLIRNDLGSLLPDQQINTIDVLTIDDAELTRRVLAAAALTSARDELDNIQAQLRKAATTQLAAQMREHADTYLDVLRPRFDEAADSARHVRALGIEPNDSAETAIGRGAEAATAWHAFKNGPAATTLRRIAEIRTGIARVLDIGEGGQVMAAGRAVVDHSIGITSPYQAGILERPHEVSTWLAAAPHLRLVPFAELDGVSIRAAKGMPAVLVPPAVQPTAR